jgi:DNA polymerase I-like protein with 3'-5' exonuclease and polymerase domains
MGRKFNVHNGGQQIPMEIVLPESNWVPPTELPDLTRFDTVSIDTETNDDGLAAGNGPAWHNKNGYVCGVSAAWEGGGIYVPITHPDTANFSEQRVGDWLGHLFRSDTLVVFQEASYDIGWIGTQFGLPPPKRIADTIAAAVMVDENRLAYDLNALCEWRGVPGKDERVLREAAAAYGFHPKRDIARLPARFVGPYGAEDSISTLALWKSLLPVMIEEGTYNAFQTEMDLLPITIAMRRQGIRINRRTAVETKQRLLDGCDRMLNELAEKLEISRRYVGIEEIRKVKTVADWHNRHNIPYPTTKTGLPSFKKEWMQDHEHWLPRSVTRIDQMYDAADKFIGKFILKFASYNALTGDYRLHPSINQYRSTDDDGATSGTRSHRFSYSKPALQEAPARDEAMCEAFRGCFEPEDGHVWGSFDYSQQEYRWMVHYAYRCNQPKAAEARQQYINDPNTDFHNLVASLTGLDRRRAKDCNFAKAYGAGIPKFALMTGMSEEAAAKAMKQYDTEMPFIAGLDEVCKQHAQRGYIIMHDGARSHFDTWEPRWIPIAVRNAAYKDPKWKTQMFPCSEEEAKIRFDTPGHPWAHPDTNRTLKRGFTRKAMNRLIQGVSARQTKVAMVHLGREGIIPLIQMHDELNVSCPDEALGKRVVEIMREAMPMSIPINVDSEYGPNWGHARTIKDKNKVVIYDASWSSAMEIMEREAA